MFSSHRFSGIGLVQLMIALVIGAIVVFGFGKVMLSVFKGATDVRALQGFEQMKMNIKLALEGCEYDFQNSDGTTITFPGATGTVSFDRIARDGTPVLKVGDVLPGGLKVNPIALIDTGVPVQTITVESENFSKYFVRLKFETTTADGEVIRVFDPPIRKAIFTDQANKFLACIEPPPPECQNITCPASNETNPYAVGVGTQKEPYVICTAEQLNNISDGSIFTPADPKIAPKDAYYCLGADIDMNDDGAGSDTPIGAPVPDGTSYNSFYRQNAFRIVFNGNGHIVRNFSCEACGFVSGFIRGVKSGAQIKNIGLENISISGDIWVGGLVGYAENTTIKNAYVTGAVSGVRVVGGLVGNATADTTIKNAYTTAPVTGSEGAVGGLVGQTRETTITNAYATGSVSGAGFVGGLVGLVHVNGNSTITNAYATGSVSGAGHVGGLLGHYRNSTITNVYATGSVTGNGSPVGGLVGFIQGTTITNAFATGSVVSEGVQVGGLVGWANGVDTIINVFATGSVSGGSTVGGLVGNANIAGDSTITNAYATGSVTGTGSLGGGTEIGGLVGSANSRITNAFATGSVSGPSSFVGGLVGRDRGTKITNVYTTSSVAGGSMFVGRILGRAHSATTITRGFWWNGAECLTSGPSCNEIGNALADVSTLEVPSYVYADPNPTAAPSGAPATFPLNHSMNLPWTFDVPDPNDGQEGNIIAQNLWSFHDDPSDGECLLPTLQFPADMPGEIDLSDMPASLRPQSQPTAVDPNAIQKSYCNTAQTLLRKVVTTINWATLFVTSCTDKLIDSSDSVIATNIIPSSINYSQEQNNSSFDVATQVGNVPGDYRYELTCTDTHGETSTSSISVTVS